MFTYMAVLLLSLGQVPCPPGQVCPLPAAKSWIKSADGKSYYGWMEQGQIRFYPQEQSVLVNKTTPPVIGAAKKPAMPITDPNNYGVDLGKLSKVDEFRAEGAGGKVNDLTLDDTGKIHMTIIEANPDERRTQNLIEASPGFAAIKDKMLVHTYAPGDWEVAGIGLSTNQGSPQVVLEQIDGKVLNRFEGSYDPAKIVAAAAEGLRRVNPNYDPSRDPITRFLCPLGFGPEHWPAIVCVSLAVAFLLYRRKVESE